MRIAIYGSGALGCYFGAKLQRHGQEVHFIARGKQLQALRTDGLHVKGPDDSFTLVDVNVMSDPLSIGPVDIVLLAVKTWQVEQALPRLSGLLHAETRVLTLQNGVETPQQIAERIGAEHVLAGIVRGFFTLGAPGVVQHVGVRPSITFGPVTKQADPLAESLYETLLAADIHAEIPPDIDAALWEKFILVTSLGGVGALIRQPIGVIRDYAPAWQMLVDSMHEIAALAQARHVKLPEDTVERLMAFVQSFPPDATASMQRDIMDGLPSELEAQTGAVLRLAAQSGVAVPVNSMIYHSLILQERRARSVD